MTDASCCVPRRDPGVPGTPELDRLRRAAFAALRAGTAARLTDLAAATGQAVGNVRALAGQLVAAGIATIEGDLAGDPAVTGAEALTVETTPHELVMGGQHLHTWCAFDTVGIPAALRLDAEARTTCSTCQAVICLDLPGGAPPPSPVVGWWPEVSGGPVNESFCPTAHLFCSRSHLDIWRTQSSQHGQSLSLPELAERGRIAWSLFADTEDRS